MLFAFMESPVWWAGGAAVVGLLVSMWGQVKGFFQHISTRLIVSEEVTGMHGVRALLTHLLEISQAAKYGPRSYSSGRMPHKPNGDFRLVYAEVIQPNRIIWIGWRFLWFTSTNPNKDDKSLAYDLLASDSIKVHYIRGMFNFEWLLKAARDKFNQRTGEEEQESKRTVKRFHVEVVSGSGDMTIINSRENGAQGSAPSAYRRGGSYDDETLEYRLDLLRTCRLLDRGLDELGHPYEEETSPIERLALPADALDMVEDLRHWKNSKQWYVDRGIPWRRSHLMVSKPGCGKTSLVRAIAQEFDWPVFMFDLSSLHNRELREKWNEKTQFRPCIILFEDLHSVFDGTEKMDGTHLTYDCFINVLDGIDERPGVVTFLTTNEPEKLASSLAEFDKAGNCIAVRPGRVDSYIQLGPLDEAGAHKLASRILCGYPDDIVEYTQRGIGLTGAVFQELCRIRAKNIHRLTVKG